MSVVIGLFILLALVVWGLDAFFRRNTRGQR